MNNYFVMDIGGSSIKWGILNKETVILRKGKLDVPKTVEEFFNNISDVINNLKNEYSLVGIAISAPGAVDSDTGVIGGTSAIPYIHGPNFKEILKEKTSLSCEMENDANCAALGETWKGAAKDEKDVAFIVCGTGIGGAIIKDKRIHKGIHLHGGEFGYCIMDFDYDNKRYKTWSEVGSTIAMANNVCREKSMELNSLNGKEVFEMAEKGDRIAIREIDRYFFNMAIGIYNIQYMYDPEVIVLGGAISEREGYLEEINKRLDEIMDINAGKIRPVVKVSKYGNSANLIGALRNYLTR